MEQTNFKAKEKENLERRVNQETNNKEREKEICSNVPASLTMISGCDGPSDDNTLEMVILLHVEGMKEGTQPEAATWVERRSSRFRGDAKVASPALLLYLSLFVIFLFFNCKKKDDNNNTRVGI